jgi:hypothetical protein
MKIPIPSLDHSLQDGCGFSPCRLDVGTRTLSPQESARSGTCYGKTSL